ncbi:MAG: AAA family ATPase, partial [Ferruginibacter sp.]
MDENLFQQRLDVTRLNESLVKIREEMARVIVGQRNMVDLLLIGLLCDGHILIEGVPGVAKTLSAKLLAKIIDVRFSRLQFTPDLMPSDVLGTSVFNPKETSFSFRSGPIFSNIILIDEINRAPAKTQAALFEVMEERQVTVDGYTHLMDYPFLVLATQNPIEQEGTYRLPEAQLDRFLFKIEVGYPTLAEEVNIMETQEGKTQTELLSQIKKILSVSEIREYRKVIQSIRVEPKLI